MSESAIGSLRSRLARNMSWTFASQIFISLAAIVTLFIAARALGPAGLGIVALAETFVRLVDLIFRLEPWQAVIRFAIRAQNKNDHGAMQRLFKLSLMIDAFGSLLTGTICVLFAGIVAPRIGLPSENGANYIYLVAAGLFVTFRPTTVAMLRVFDRFDVLAKLDIASATIRMILSLIAWLSGLDVWAFLAILLIQSIFDGVFGLPFAMRVMRNRGYGGFLNANGLAAIRENPGFLRLVWNSNVNVILRQSVNRFDVLILGAMTNPTAVGMYQLGKRVMNRVTKLSAPVRQTIYPEMSRLWEQGRIAAFNRLIVIVSASLLSLQLVFAIPVMLNIEPIIHIIFGPEFAGAGPVMNILLASSIVIASGVALNPALLSMGKDRLLVLVTLGATAIFAVSFLPLVKLFGVEGAAYANLLFNVSWTIGCAFGLRGIRARRTRTGDD
ncbi:lipopolysaccharide biosynthesis protein [Paracoccus sp. SCSIO 75233]|uniref:lipopolysaccharide biosynthesis protein n=1 Tax=Paracoccus sp. SCSIO 75233 TaxID=3017782 RepID=UPI0022F0E369|nr:oligosaccharide flippase family protein [Paracoccus sp. SCSIO 75233]WBU52368.1 oligosaccharide flippase family protein [Paracoccus sp. SCSIO 75233]